MVLYFTSVPYTRNIICFQTLHTLYYYPVKKFLLIPPPLSQLSIQIEKVKIKEDSRYLHSLRRKYLI